MATDGSRWVIELVDRMSGPAGRAASGIQRVGNAVAWVGGPLGRFGSTLANAGKGLNDVFAGRGTTASLTAIGRGVGAIAGPVGMVAGAAVDAGMSFVSMATDAAGALARVGYALGENIVSLAAFRESSLAALEAVSGSAEVAGRSFQNAITIANQTPGDTQDIAAMSQRFMVAGFSERETLNMLGATSDIQAAFGTNQANSLALVLSQMRAAGRMDRGDLRQMLNAGLNTGEVLDSIGRQLHITGATDRARRESVLKALSSRRVDGDTGIQAALDAISHRLDGGGALGSYALRQSETLRGALSNARNAWNNLILGMDVEHLPGLEAFKHAVLDITRGLDGAAPAGRALRGIISDITGIVGRGLFGDINTDSIDAIGNTLEEMRPTIRAVVEGITAFSRGLGAGVLREVLPLVQEFIAAGNEGESQAESWSRLGETIGEALGIAVRVFVGVTDAGVRFVRWTNETLISIEERWRQFSDFMAGVPSAMADGFIDGLLGNWPRITSALGSLSELLPGAVEQPLEIASPSRRMRRDGGHIAEGLALGIDDGRGRVGRAMEDLAPGSPGSLGAVGGRAGGVGDVSIVVQVAAPREGETPESFGARVGRGLAAELADLFATLNAGPAPAAA